MVARSYHHYIEATEPVDAQLFNTHRRIPCSVVMVGVLRVMGLWGTP